MRKLAMLAAAALVLGATQISAEPAQAKSLGSMLDSAANALSGRSAYYNQFRYGYPYGYYANPYSGYGYNPYPYRHHYYGNRRYYNPWY
ncbi:MAG TPA: hypothetical protein V6D22_16180 [Candidatus Obscuribacterales bacterium]